MERLSGVLWYIFWAVQKFGKYKNQLLLNFRDVVKHELRAKSNELKVKSTSWNSKVQVQIHEFQVQVDELRVQIYELQL